MLVDDSEGMYAIDHPTFGIGSSEDLVPSGASTVIGLRAWDRMT